MPEAATPPSNATRPGCPSEYQLDINGRLASPTHLSRQEQDAMLSQNANSSAVGSASSPAASWMI